MSLPIVVIGGGLSGLYAAHLLEQAGQRVLLIEARERLGGRILSRGHADDRHRLDLGPSWFWPAMNPLVAGTGVDARAGRVCAAHPGRHRHRRARRAGAPPTGHLAAVACVVPCRRRNAAPDRRIAGRGLRQGPTS
ncbi:MAG: NAD(P)/FAD-dependent oxidoreductase [Acidovorax sp.]|nr:NAD(P)/FAD-dependent oxidoreductase [Acidovorax sp.]